MKIWSVLRSFLRELETTYLDSKRSNVARCLERLASLLCVAVNLPVPGRLYCVFLFASLRAPLLRSLFLSLQKMNDDKYRQQIINEIEW
jgi:hypothetical protein